MQRCHVDLASMELVDDPDEPRLIVERIVLADRAEKEQERREHDTVQLVPSSARDLGNIEAVEARLLAGRLSGAAGGAADARLDG